MTISLCLIIKDEQDVLDRCLSSFTDIVDEIIIVDTGSIDNSIEIAKKYTNKIYNYMWNNDFASARNFSISKASMDYFMWVDADDYLKEDQKEKLFKLKSNENSDIDMYYFLYDFNVNYEPFYRERLIKNNRKHMFKGKIHEAITPSGNIKYEDIIITQFDKNKPLSNRNIAIFESMKKEEFTLRDIYYYAKELYRHNKLERSKKMFVKFIKSNEGYIEDIIDSYYVLSMIYKKENDFKNALKALFESFNYDIPRANILSEIGSIYLQKQDIKKAIYYYQLALNCSKNNKSFILKDYYGYIPCIQLSVCYYFLNDIDSAIKYNELANTYKKEGKEYMHNKDFYKKLIKID